MVYTPGFGLPNLSFSGISKGMGSISSYFRNLEKQTFDDEWAIKAAAESVGIRYEADPDKREEIFTKVMEKYPKSFDKFMRTYDAIRPNGGEKYDNTRGVSGVSNNYTPKESKTKLRWLAAAGGALVGALAVAAGVNAYNADEDGGVNVQPKPIINDDDGDGLTNDEEVAYGTNPKMADTDLDGLNDYMEVKVLGTNPLALDILATCHVKDPEKYPYISSALEKVKSDLKNKVNFVNVDGSKGINLHLTNRCETIPSHLNFNGAGPVPNFDALHKTSLGLYLEDVANSRSDGTTLQIVFTDFKNSGFENYAAFPSLLTRQVIVDPSYSEDSVKRLVDHEIGRFIMTGAANLDGPGQSSTKTDSVMRNTPGNTFYDEEWVASLEDKKVRGEALFEQKAYN